MKRLVVIFTLIMIMTSCTIGGFPRLEKAEFIDSKTLYIYLDGSTSEDISYDFDIIVNNTDFSYRITSMVYNIFNGDKQGNLYRYRCTLNKKVLPGDLLTIEGNYDISGSVSITYQD